MPSLHKATTTKQHTNSNKKQQVCCPSCGRSNILWYQRFNSLFDGLFSGWTGYAGIAATIITISENIKSVFPSSIPRELASRFYNFFELARAKKQGIWWHIGDRICRFGTRTQDVGLKAKHHAAAKAEKKPRRHRRSNSRLLTWIRRGEVYEGLDGERVRIE
ncbi:uncharacterized protein PG998_001561 [Apiospora kogelbergensis]|uniref:uncharacterized protein n=1 Tax=Apiospora kogelbergensis TaxID=1337665 RepID=UPI003130E91A